MSLGPMTLSPVHLGPLLRNAHGSARGAVEAGDGGARNPSADVTGAPWLTELLVVVAAARAQDTQAEGEEYSGLKFSSNRLNWISEAVTVLYNPG
ncbi:hypothetical protein PDJAM_G00088870 [Pangasius djambal]|uniref:Uncharacterized protein n=1 Tax=Pangasius djambal TaxID=1691987 RepID=A0ACC5Z4U3_9TELE|nr:hypothetical protein [Pangasius djambal]